VIIGVSQIIQFKRRDSRLGELLFVCLMLIPCFRVVLIDVMYVLGLGWILAKFWKISKNRLAALKARQAAHAANVLFLGSAMHCLAAKGSPPGDTYWVAQFLLIFLILVVCKAWEEYWDSNGVGMMDYQL